MAVSVRKARDFVYGSGTLLERALFSYLFENGDLARVHQILSSYKNPDNGWGHGLEHDLKCPYSNPAQLEYLLTLSRDIDLPLGDLLEGTPHWLESILNPDGSLQNPPTIRDYPLAPWWDEWGGQTAPDSIVGNLTRLGVVTPRLAEATRRWVQENVTLEKIHTTDWLFMNYHYADYFLNVQDFPDGSAYRSATIQNISACAEKLPEKQYYVLLQFAPRPDSALAQELPDHLLPRTLDYLMETQHDDGHWNDEHSLPQWLPAVTISVLNALRSYGRITV